MGIAVILGDWVAHLSYNDLPRRVVTLTKGRILDFVGTAFDSYARYPMTPVIAVLRSISRKQEATVIGKGIKLPCSFAAMVNSAYNISDGSRFTGAHPACVIVPAVLAAAEFRDRFQPVQGKELITAIVSGYEVMLRIGSTMYPSSHNRGFSPTTLQGTIGAAAAVGKILNHEKEKIIHSISIASLMSHGLQAADRAPYPTFSFQTGRAAEAGVLCALVAHRGLLGSDDILEEGFLPAFSDQAFLPAVKNDLGRKFFIEQTYIKIHGGCRHMHGPIDAALHLRKSYAIQWESIEQIQVKTYSTALAVCNINNPETGRQAEYTIRFGVPVALIFGDVSPDRFADSVLHDPRVRELMSRTSVQLDLEMDREYPQKRPAYVEIITKDGRTFSHRQEYAKGESENPLSSFELVTKFKNMTARALDEKTRDKIIGFFDELEKRKKITDLFPLLKATIHKM